MSIMRFLNKNLVHAAHGKPAIQKFLCPTISVECTFSQVPIDRGSVLANYAIETHFDNAVVRITAESRLFLAEKFPNLSDTRSASDRLAGGYKEKLSRCQTSKICTQKSPVSRRSSKDQRDVLLGHSK